MLTELQQRKIKNLFAVHDLDRDGVLSASDYEEYTRRIAAARGFAPGSPEYGELLSRFMRMWQDLESTANQNQDARVTLSEWYAYYDRLLTTHGLYDQVGEPIAEAVFGMLDRNGDGAVTADEYAWLYSSGGLDPAMAAAAFSRLDTNHDGRVSPAELSQLLREFFNSNDPESPGNWLFGPF